MKPINLDLKDIQGFLVRSYGDLLFARYILLRFCSISGGRKFLSNILPLITSASSKPIDLAMHIAFTNRGVFKFLPANRFTAPFSREFTEGMIDETRSRILGDIGPNDPSTWQWGGDKGHYEEAVLMLFANSSSLLNQEYEKIKAQLGLYDIVYEALPETVDLCGREHFGFVDGLSNPLIKGMEATKPNKRAASKNSAELVYSMPGEFIIGYPNEYNQLPFSPHFEGKHGLIDIGKNGSYMVMRQMRQDVSRFWRYMFDEVRSNPQLAGLRPEQLAAKLVGREPDGKPLAPTNKQHDDSQNDFLYAALDKHGFHCPMGAHIRKMNPRDAIDDNPTQSIEITKKHRIIRRGRAYGLPLSKEFKPEEMIQTDGQKRGLFFICLNSQIRRQFEFLQHSWANNNKFPNLYNDVDPLIGVGTNKIMAGNTISSQFTIQGCPVRKQVRLPQFVFVEGGAYFFMPGLEVLQLICAENS